MFNRFTPILLSIICAMSISGCDQKSNAGIEEMTKEDFEKLNAQHAAEIRAARPALDADPFGHLTGAWEPVKDGAATGLYFGEVDGNRIVDYSDGPVGWRAKVESIRCEGQNCTINIDDDILFRLQVLSEDQIKIIVSHPRLGGKAFEGRLLNRRV